MSKLKSIADNKLNVTQELLFIFRGLDSLVRKGENVVQQHFLSFFLCVSEGLFFRVVKTDCRGVKKVNLSKGLDSNNSETKTTV